MTGVLGGVRETVLNNPQVRDSLGSEYREIEAYLGDDKSSEVANLIFYNYATNETVGVKLDKDGSVITEVFSASSFQPNEHPQEVEDAISLASADLATNGFDLTDLQGTAMLAFPPVNEIESQNSHFYPQRMLYVTFGSGQGELPLYTALVDLSANSVVESGLVR